MHGLQCSAYAYTPPANTRSLPFLLHFPSFHTACCPYGLPLLLFSFPASLLPSLPLSVPLSLPPSPPTSLPHSLLPFQCAPCVCKKGPRCLYIMLLPFRIIAQVLCLLWLLCVKLKPPDFYLLQVRAEGGG